MTDVVAIGILLDPFWMPEASLRGTACLDDTFPCASGTLAPLPMLPVVPGSLARLPHESSLGAIRNVLTLDGTALDPLDSVTASSVTNRFIPEPPPWTLLAAGLLLHRALARGRSRRATFVAVNRSATQELNASP
jgi:hypothetical protein